MPVAVHYQSLARPYRKSLLAALLVITFFSGLLFAWINIGRANYPVAAVELLMAGYSAVLLVTMRRAQYLERWILAYLLPFFTVMMIALAAPRSTLNVFIWVLLIPLVAHLLLGRRNGLAMSVFYISVAALIFLWRFHDNAEVMQPVIISNISVLTICILVFSHVYEITREQSEARLLQMAQTDPLTGLPNRARLVDVFEHEKHRHLRNNLPLSLVMLDLDYFKRVNDQHGHEVGDQVLLHVAALFRAVLRKGDLVVRMGGEEFCLLLPETGIDQAAEVAEKIRRTIETSPLQMQERAIFLTVSAGVAQMPVVGASLSDMIGDADDKLYRAKKHGRNQVTC